MSNIQGTQRPKPEELLPIYPWPVPLGGVYRTVSAEGLPAEALYDALNVVPRNGVLQLRPGYVSASNTLTGRGVGLFEHVQIRGVGVDVGFQGNAFQNNAFQVTAGQELVGSIVGMTNTKIARLSGNTWIDLTDVALTALPASQGQACAIEIGGSSILVMTNGQDTPRSWNGVDATVAQIAGTPPKWTDIVTLGGRVLGIIPPYAVRWGNYLNLTTWPALNFKPLADTVDGLVAIEQLGAESAVIYKQRSIWLVSIVGGSDAAFFRFDLRAVADGPSSPAAVVDLGGVHLYMTSTGRVGMFDGVSQNWVADGIWPLIRADIDPELAKRTSGVYDPITGLVTFFYPRVGDGGAVKGMLICLPPHISGTEGFSFFPGRTTMDITACHAQIGSARQTFVFAGETPTQLFLQSEGASDNTTNFTGSWQTGLQEPEGRGVYRLDGVETFVERGANYGTLTVTPLTSYLLTNPSGTLGTPVNINLAQIPSGPHEVQAGDHRARFVGLKYSITQPATLRFHGAQAMGRRLE